MAMLKFISSIYFMLIRRAVLNDIPSIMKVILEVVPLMNEEGNLQWDHTYPNAVVFTEDINRDQLWIAEVHNKIAGVAAITTDQDSEYAQVGWNLAETAIVTHRLAVSPNYRGLGVAALLLQQAESEAIRRNIKALRIDTNTKNPATQKLFPKLGYVYAGEISLGFRPGLRFYCYEKRLD